MNNQEMVRDYREMEASARERGMHESAKSWQGLAEAAQRDLERESQGCWEQEQGMQALEETMWARYQEEDAIEPLEEGFSIGQHVYERDTFAPGVITAIDEDGIAEVLFSNGNTDGVSLEDLTTSADPRREEF